MIERYSLPKMRAVWQDENKYQKWLEIEIGACEAQAELGVIPEEAVAEIKEKAGFDAKRVSEIEKEVQHDVIAFLTAVAEKVGPASKFIHYGMTSYDVVDNGLSLLLRDAIDILIEDVKQVIAILKTRAREFKDTIMIGRTHGIHAEPITFGLKLLRWVFEMERSLRRLEQAKSVISYGKISGAVGTYANIDPRVEKSVLGKLGLKPAEVSSQILQRDRHAEYMSALAITASSLDKFATEIRTLQRTEILEVEEPFHAQQKGSSAMPHKRNPIVSERICGLARVIRGNAQAAYENIILWDERDISNSSVERIIFPDSTIFLDYMLQKFSQLIKGLKVYPENMRKNLEKTQGLVHSQRVLLKLIEKGMLREDAYRLVQGMAMRVWAGEGDFRELLLGHSEITKHLSAEEVDSLLDYSYYLRHVDQVFERAS
ncbi:MAG: adenylosuccinate lyase [Actinomycetota bacterium]